MLEEGLDLAVHLRKRGQLANFSRVEVVWTSVSMTMIFCHAGYRKRSRKKVFTESADLRLC